MPGKRFGCYLIGGNTLLIECGEILLKRDHEICGLITSSERLRDWARDRAIPVLDPNSEYGEFLKRRPFEFLFSIAHLAVVPERVLALPAVAAINFHDGPLPHFAGLNTPAWALIRGETEYGITWHKMTARLDQGEILKQVSFSVQEEDTALSLNARCFEYAIQSFGPLVDELARGDVRALPQDLANYRYFGKNDRPPAAAALDWSRDAESLVRLVRALDFGPYENPLGLPKLVFKGEVSFVKTATAGKVSGRPGTVLSVDDPGLVVAAGSGSLTVREFITSGGGTITADDWLARHKARPGDRFDMPPPETVEQLTGLNGLLAKSEGFWVRTLSRTIPAINPFPLAFSVQNETVRQPVSIPDGFHDRLSGEPIVNLIASFGAMFARVGAGSRYDLGFYDEPNLKPYLDLKAWIATRTPLRIRLGQRDSLSTLITFIAKNIRRIRKHRTWFKDLPARYGALVGRQMTDGGLGSAVAVALTEDPIGYRPGTAETITLVLDPNGSRVFLAVRQNEKEPEAATRIRNRFEVFLANLVLDPEQSISQVSLMSEPERDQVLVAWNRTGIDHASDKPAHAFFKEQAARTPIRTAAVFAGSPLSYAALDRRAGQIAAHLRNLGIGPNHIVAIHLPRSNDMLAAMLGVLEIGAAYLPLDPSYPKERTRFILKDSGTAAILTLTLLEIPDNGPVVSRIGDISLVLDEGPIPDSDIDSASLAYLIYTSGSTGTPKGVMVTHRNLTNFFMAMDPVIPHDPPGTWLAVTSLSFDISVLELLWTLTRGFKVVIQDETRYGATRNSAAASRSMAFGLFYFSSNAAVEGTEKYKLLLEGARYADRHGFNAVWTPERHFHAFGGLYPEPAVTGAAVAAVTEHVQIRAGSVVLPLHHPIRVAEAWSVVDNISAGRVAVSFASGWQPNDFVLRPENYKNAKQAMFRDIEIVRKLWRGETLSFPGATGESVPVSTLPRPVQKELPIWITTAGNPETYRMAGEIGANVLTHLLGQSTEDLAPKIQAYREALAANGHEPGSGIVSLMLHTFVGPDEKKVRDLVREPLKSYLGSSLNLLKKYAWAFPAFAKPDGSVDDPNEGFEGLSDEEQDAVLEHAYERYYRTSGLFGKTETCLEMVERLKAIGVDEIACLIDFGAPTEQVLAHLPYLNEVRANADPSARAVEPAGKSETFAGLVADHEVTHLQCTPSMLRMLIRDEPSRRALATIPHLMVGGEAFPDDLAHAVGRIACGSVTNMYGPTETTIWSTVQLLGPEVQGVPIGRPIANTGAYSLDHRLQPVPPGLTGELFLAGDGVACGYLNRPGLTAERFVPDPFPMGIRREGGRLYRTGDLVRFRARGVIEFLGRVDHQVKVRGFRIEPGEIETRLTRFEGIREAVVVARPDRESGSRLTAYLVVDGEPPVENGLRDWLRTVFPEYMIPTDFAVLERLPLTPNKKIDRNALPDPNTARTRTMTGYTAPENELETRIAAVWQRILGRPRIGIDDNFFESGGHSLLAVRMFRELAKIVEKPIALTDLYQYTTIRALSKFLTRGESKQFLQKSMDRAQRRLASRRG